MISRNGKPVARVVPIVQKIDVSQRIGIAQGEFSVPENIDSANQEVADLFYGKSVDDVSVA